MESSMSDLTNIGIQSLLANQYALSITSQNIANANTPYYSRRMLDFTENSFNHGVSVSDVRRITDEAANKNAQMANTNFSEMDSYLQQLNNLEPMFDDQQTGVSRYITDSIAALEKLNANAAATQDRGLYLSSLAAMSNRIQNMNGELNRQLQEVNQSTQTAMGQVNNLLSSIASINDQLTGPVNENTPALLDKRDGLIHDLSKYFNFTTMVDSNGIMSVNLSNGLSLVSGSHAQTLTTITDPTNSNNVLIAVKDNSSNTPISNFIQSGQLAALAKFRQNALLPSQQGLARLSMAMAQSFNAQNHLGIDLNGNLGGDIFNDINSANAINSRVISNLNNSGSGSFTVNINNVSQLQISDYKLSIGASNAYVLTRISDNSVVSSGTISGTFPQTVSADGFTINVNGGTFSAGDQYTISPTNGGANNFVLATNDPSKLALGWPVAASVGTQAQGSTGSIHVTDVTDTTNSAFSVAKQLNPPITIRFLTATTYELVNATTSAVIETGIPYTADKNIFPTPGAYNPGYQVTLSGTVQAGDTFNIKYNTNQGSNENGLKMATLYQKQILQNSSLTFSQGYGSVSSNVSILTNQARSGYEATQALNSQAESRRDAISGVSLEEETMNLARFQQAYQASAQILETAKSVLQSVIEIARR